MATPNQATGWAALPANFRTPVDTVLNEVRNVCQGEIRRQTRVAFVGALAFAALGYVTMALSPLGAVLAFGASVVCVLKTLDKATFNWKISSLVEKIKNFIGNTYLNPLPVLNMMNNYGQVLPQMVAQVQANAAAQATAQA